MKPSRTCIIVRNKNYKSEYYFIIELSRLNEKYTDFFSNNDVTS